MNNLELSKGCQLCQEGKWLCVFLTYLCNANCYFCPAPFKHDITITAFGNDPKKILFYLQNNDFKGISFSGGEVLVVYDRLIEWLHFFKTNLSPFYFWLYTNGLALNRSKIKKLAANGLDEIRFNIAATSYSSNKILELIRISKDYIPIVTVEIPSIPNDYNKLIEILPVLEKHKTDYLNLHEYMLNAKNLSNSVVGNHKINKVVDLKYDIHSVDNTQKIIAYCEANNFNIKINNCTLAKKDEQMKQRRLKMAGIFKNKYDFISEDGYIINYVALPANLSSSQIDEIIHKPSGLKNLLSYSIEYEIIEAFKKVSNTLIELKFIPAMEINQSKQFIEFKIIN